MGVVSERKLSFTAPRRNRSDSDLFHGPQRSATVPVEMGPTERAAGKSVGNK